MTLAQFLVWASSARCIVWVHPHTEWIYQGPCRAAIYYATWLHLVWGFLP